MKQTLGNTVLKKKNSKLFPRRAGLSCPWLLEDRMAEGEI
jgi:hypothetical protein